MDDSTQNVPPEFQIDTSDARPIDAQTLKDQLEELMGMRGWLARSERELYQCQTQFEELEQDTRKQMVNVLALTVEMVDQLRRLVADAQRSLEGSPDELEKSGLFGKLFRGKGAGESDSAQQWLGTFQRLVASATDQLENYGVHHVPLLGADLQELQFDGQLMKRWIAVKSQTDPERLVVAQEIQGLWVCKRNGQLFPIQRGEIIA